MSTIKDSFFIRFGFCIAIIIVPFFLINTLIYFIFIYKNEKWLLSSAQKAVQSVESVIEYGEISNRAALKVKNLPCKYAALELRRQATVVPYVRSVNLAKNENIYCTSLFGDSNFKDNSSKYRDGKLLLMPGNKVQNNHPIIVVRNVLGDTSSLSGIDSIYLTKLLSQQEGDDLLLFLYINEEWLTEDGLFILEDPVRYLSMQKSSHSDKYPFAIYAGLNYRSAFDAYWEHDKIYIAGLFSILACFSLAMWWQLNRPQTFTSELVRALKKHEFIPYAQPLVDSASRKIIGIEILMRWQHPTQGLIRPDLFIPHAEESRLIVPMTVSILKETTSTLKKYNYLIPKNFHVGINITAQHCEGMRLLWDCQEFLAEMKLEGVNLVLELTERQEIESNEHILNLFTRLNKMGVMLALDDFGTGHSSLGYLKDFKVGCLKIDMSFVKQIGEGSLSEHLIDNIIDLGRRLSLTLVAEGVENEMQAKYLQEKGVTYLQGYMFGKPMPLNEVLKKLEVTDNSCASTLRDP